MDKPFLFALSQFWFELLNVWVIHNRKFLLYVVPKFLNGFKIGHGCSKARFNCIQDPWYQHKLNNPPILYHRGFFFRFLDGSINELPFSSCSQGCLHSSKFSPCSCTCVITLPRLSYWSWDHRVMAFSSEIDHLVSQSHKTMNLFLFP
jgi:hypothetical protein